MNPSTDTPQGPAISASLARWYTTNPSIRRLWAIEDENESLNVFVAIEPTSDGDDTLPVWFARRHHWASELMSITQREIQLELVVSDVPDQAYDTRRALIAELSWRDSWSSP